MTFELILISAAFLGALLFVFGAAVGLEITALRRQGFVSYFTLLILMLGAVYVASVTRNLSAEVPFAAAPPPTPQTYVLLARISSLFLLLASIERLISYVVNAASGIRRERWIPLPLLFAFALMWVTTVLLPAIFGSVSHFENQFVFTFLLGCAALTVSYTESVRAIEIGRNASLLFLLASVAAIPFFPVEHTLESPYLEGMIPGLPRLHGLSPHAVTLGMLALYCAICLTAHPFRKGWANFCAWALTVGVLILAQSKTAWLTFALCWLAMITIRSGPKIARAIASRSGPFRLLLLLLAIGLGYVGFSALLTFGEFGSRIDVYLASDAGARLTSLTNRDLIWEFALQEWRRSPIFGYGPTLFDRDYRLSIGVAAAAHGHNQFMDTLARSGVVGVTGLTVYSLALTYYAFKFARASRGLSVALYLVMLIRGVTEVPLALSEHSPELIPHITFLMLIAGLHSRHSGGSQALASSSPKATRLYLAR